MLTSGWRCWENANWACVNAFCKQRTVNMLDGGGLQIKQFGGGPHRLGHGRKEQQAHAALGRKGNDLQFGVNNRGERAFAAGDDVSQIPRLAHLPGQRVSGPAFQKARWKALDNLQLVQRSQAFQQAALARQRVLAATDPYHAPVAG